MTIGVGKSFRFYLDPRFETLYTGVPPTIPPGQFVVVIHRYLSAPVNVIAVSQLTI
jgi:hypothetical protein